MRNAILGGLVVALGGGCIEVPPPASDDDIPADAAVGETALVCPRGPTSSAVFPPVGRSVNINDAVVADVDGNGEADLVLADAGASGLWVLLGPIDPAAPRFHDFVPLETTPFRIAAAELTYERPSVCDDIVVLGFERLEVLAATSASGEVLTSVLDHPLDFRVERFPLSISATAGAIIVADPTHTQALDLETNGTFAGPVAVPEVVGGANWTAPEGWTGTRGLVSTRLFSDDAYPGVLMFRGDGAQWFDRSLQSPSFIAGAIASLAVTPLTVHTWSGLNTQGMLVAGDGGIGAYVLGNVGLDATLSARPAAADISAPSGTVIDAAWTSFDGSGDDAVMLHRNPIGEFEILWTESVFPSLDEVGASGLSGSFALPDAIEPVAVEPVGDRLLVIERSGEIVCVERRAEVAAMRLCL